MAGLAGQQFEAEPGAQRRFFERHLKPWAARFFSDLETTKAAQFYKPVGRIGSLFMAVEAEAFAMDT
jgi:TorA maturation chaperone TorD